MSNKKRISKKRKQIENNNSYQIALNCIIRAMTRVQETIKAIKMSKASENRGKPFIPNFYPEGGRRLGKTHLLTEFIKSTGEPELFSYFSGKNDDGSEWKLNVKDLPKNEGVNSMQLRNVMQNNLSLTVNDMTKFAEALNSLPKKLEGALALERQKDGSTKSGFYGAKTMRG